MRSISILLMMACMDATDQGTASNSCEEYVEYMCNCHPEEGSCSDLHTQFEDPTPDDMENCAVDLDAQIETDTTNGTECEQEEI